MRDDDLATFATVDDVLANTAAIRRADALRNCAEVLKQVINGLVRPSPAALSPGYPSQRGGGAFLSGLSCP